MQHLQRVGKYAGFSFSSLWTKDHKILGKCREPLATIYITFRYEILAIGSREKKDQSRQFWAPIFWARARNVYSNLYAIYPYHMAKIGELAFVDLRLRSLAKKENATFAEVGLKWKSILALCGSQFIQLLPERDYVTFASLLLQFRLSSVCKVGAPYSGVEAFGNISSPLCTLAILWPPCKILRR